MTEEGGEFPPTPLLWELDATGEASMYHEGGLGPQQGYQWPPRRRKAQGCPTGESTSPVTAAGYGSRVGQASQYRNGKRRSYRPSRRVTSWIRNF